jgi:hypothetical protein
MNTDNLQDMINAIVIANTESFYKKFIVKRGNDDYLDNEKYHKKYSNNEMWKLGWAYQQYQKWRDSDVYIKDITYIENEFWNDILEGFVSRMDEIIDDEDCDDEDCDDKSRFIKMREEFSSIKTKTEKMEYLSKEYDKKYYYPVFSYLWLYNYYEDQVVTKTNVFNLYQFV